MTPHMTAMSGAGLVLHSSSAPESMADSTCVYVSTACSSRYPTNLWNEQVCGE